MWGKTFNYQDLFKNYTVSNYFNIVNITIKYTLRPEDARLDSKDYKIKGLEIEQNVTEELSEFIKKINKGLNQNKYPSDWQMFYLFKELFQYFSTNKQTSNRSNGETSNRYNYFRGQSHDFELRPGILRENIKNEYRENFEKIYSDFSKKYPNELQYFEISEKSVEREQQLSLLQHYGLATSLLDITANPFIGLLFMLTGDVEIEINERKTLAIPTFYFFEINMNDTPLLFSEVRRSDKNKRLSAQRGAFLNFDKLANQGEIKLINVIKLTMVFEEEASSSIHQLEDCEKLERKKECLKSIQKEMIEKLKEFYYFEEDLYPDFEKQIGYLINKYKVNEKRVKLNLNSFKSEEL